LVANEAALRASKQSAEANVAQARARADPAVLKDLEASKVRSARARACLGLTWADAAKN